MRVAMMVQTLRMAESQEWRYTACRGRRPDSALQRGQDVQGGGGHLDELGLELHVEGQPWCGGRGGRSRRRWWRWSASGKPSKSQGEASTRFSRVLRRGKLLGGQGGPGLAKRIIARRVAAHQGPQAGPLGGGHLLGDMCTGQGGQGKGDPGEAKGSKGGGCLLRMQAHLRFVYTLKKFKN